jgi:hypothetical protein
MGGRSRRDPSFSSARQGKGWPSSARMGMAPPLPTPFAGKRCCSVLLSDETQILLWRDPYASLRAVVQGWPSSARMGVVPPLPTPFADKPWCRRGRGRGRRPCSLGFLSELVRVMPVQGRFGVEGDGVGRAALRLRSRLGRSSQFSIPGHTHPNVN